jgi:hypothetical protein
LWGQLLLAVHHAFHTLLPRTLAAPHTQLLIDLVCCQEELEHILRAQVALLEQAEGLPPEQAAHMSVAATASGNNRCNSMLAGVTVQQLRQVQAMTAQQWVDVGAWGVRARASM